MKILRTLFGDIITIDAQDREEVRRLEQRLKALDTLVDNLELDNIYLTKSIEKLDAILDCYQSQNDNLNEALSIAEERLRIKERYVATMKDLIRSIID